MIDHNVEEEIDIALFLKHFYKKRGLIFRVLTIALGLSFVYSGFTFFTNPAIYTYTSHSVIDMTIGEGAEFQKSMLISYLVGEKIFDESAKSIGLEASYAAWRNSIVVENIKDTNQIVLKISAPTTDKLVELNRRIVSNTIFQTKNILTGLSVRTLEEAKLLDEVQEVRENVNFVSNLFIFGMLGLMSIIGWLTLQVIVDRRIKRSEDIETFTGLHVIGTIPDFENLTVTEEINLRNFMRGLTWKKKK
jgi:capsular polysaccharide biosynthesis protein